MSVSVSTHAACTALPPALCGGDASVCVCVRVCVCACVCVCVGVWVCGCVVSHAREQNAMPYVSCLKQGVGPIRPWRFVSTQPHDPPASMHMIPIHLFRPPKQYRPMGRALRRARPRTNRDSGTTIAKHGGTWLQYR